MQSYGSGKVNINSTRFKRFKLQIMINFDHFKYNKASLPTDADERQKFFKQLEHEFYEEVKNSETAGAYFANYRPDSIDNFIKTYATRKVHLLQCYEFYSDEYHEKEISELNYQKKAEEMLQSILQKKLFNMQLRWRAGQLVIDGIDIAYDFEFWTNHILACPFVPTITRHELELMKEYLLRFDEDDEVDNRYIRWQDYDSLIEKNERGDMEDMPDWYDFYDSRMGTRMLLLLPNHKGTMENFYLDFWRKSAETVNPVNTVEPAPYLYGWGQHIFDFAKHFEKDKYFSALFKYYKYYEGKDHQRPNFEDLKQTVEYLLTADRPVYMKSHLTWDKALMVAAKEYRNTRIVEALDFAFDEYLMMKELGFSKDKSPEEITNEYANDHLVQLFREKILQGRVLNGEPEDFNY
jgi:hypothetical protein